MLVRETQEQECRPIPEGVTRGGDTGVRSPPASQAHVGVRGGRTRSAGMEAPPKAE